MGSDLYDVRVERWTRGTLEEMAARAAAQGLDEELARAAIRRGGTGEGAVEIDLYIHQVHPDAPIWELDLAYLVMTVHAAGFWPANLEHVSERLEAHFGGFDRINSSEFAPGPADAPIAFTLLERGTDPGDPERYDADDESFVPPPEDWARVRIWLAEELGRGMEGVRWDSRAWSPAGERTWMNHFPPAGLASRLGEREAPIRAFPGSANTPPYMQSVAVAETRVFFMEDDTGAVCCFDRQSGEERWRRADISDNRMGGGLGLSRDGTRLYLTAYRGWAGYTNLDGEGFVRLPDAATSALLQEDAEGVLFELQIYTEGEQDTEPGAVWLRDRKTGERVKRIAEHRHNPALAQDDAEIMSHAFASAAPVGASVTRKGDLAVWDRQGERARAWLPEGDVSGIALSPEGGTVYAVYNDGRLLAWDVAEGRVIWQEHMSGKGHGSRLLAASPDGTTLAMTAMGRVQIVDLARRAAIVHLRPMAESPQGLLLHLGFTPRGDALHVSVDQKTLCLWPICGPQGDLATSR